MCGIIGIANGNIPERIFAALISLQHRGQDGAGILTYNKERDEFILRKGDGYVYDVFNQKNIKELEGDIGIGHVRYPTFGSDFERDSQPFFVEKPARIGLCHNGNIVNYTQLKKQYKDRLESGCDCELILHILADEYENEGDIFSAVKNTMQKLNGSYSVVGIIEDSLFIFRDPHAIRPLILGENSASSETIALDIINEDVIRDVKGGECIVIKDGKRKEKILINGNPRHCMFEWVYFSRPDSTIEKKSVYQTRFNLGKELAKIWKGRADVVIPVPDTARPCAQAFSDESGIPYREGLIKNRYIQRTFIMPLGIRDGAMSLKLNPIIQEIKGKRVVLADDSIIRGTTTKRLVKLVRSAKAKKVHMLVSCPPIVWPCFYGIDMTRRGEFIAKKYEGPQLVEKVAEEIGADSVTYQTLEGLKRAIGLNLCTGCLTGEYPTDVKDLLSKSGKGRPYEME